MQGRRIIAGGFNDVLGVLDHAPASLAHQSDCGTGCQHRCVKVRISIIWKGLHSITSHSAVQDDQTVQTPISIQLV